MAHKQEPFVTAYQFVKWVRDFNTPRRKIEGRIRHRIDFDVSRDEYLFLRYIEPHKPGSAFGFRTRIKIDPIVLVELDCSVWRDYIALKLKELRFLSLNRAP